MDFQKNENYGPSMKAVGVISGCVLKHEAKHIETEKPNCQGKADATSCGLAAQGAAVHKRECEGYTEEVKCWDEYKTSPCPKGDAQCENALAKRYGNIRFWKDTHCAGKDAAGAPGANYAPLPWKK